MANLATVGIGGLLVSLFIKSIYRLYFHPLSKIPGPKLAAASSAYIFYFNVIKRGMLIWELERLHEVYGPIVRVSPSEVHIKDSSYYEDVYASRLRVREKDFASIRQFDLEGSAFASISAEDHRERRAPLDKFFSKSAINKMENTIHKSLDQLREHLTSACRSYKVVNLDAGFAGLAADIINQYSLGYHSGNLDQEDFNEHVRDGINALFQSAHIMFFFPILKTVFDCLPLSALKVISPSAFALADQKIDIHNRVSNILVGNRSEHGSIMESLADSGLPEHLRGSERLANDAFAILIGGTETTARSLALGFYHILSDNTINAKMREELRFVMPTPQTRPTWSQLEQLPYLSGIVLETLRLSTGIATRSPRVAPTETLVYKGHTIPPGTLISQTNYFVLMDPAIFPNPHAFDPERWMRAAAKGESLHRYLVNFGKGTRICLGMNLAYAELYLTLATLIRQFEFELYNTTEKNIAFVRDFGTPYPDEGNYSLKVLVKGLVQE